MGADRHLECDLGLLVLTLACVQHGEVVIRLWQFRVVVGQCGEDTDGLIGVALLIHDQAFEEACLCIFWLGGKEGIHLLKCLCVLPLLEQFVSVLDVIREARRAE